MRLESDNPRPALGSKPDAGKPARPRGRRTPVPVRLSDQGIAEVDEVAQREFKGTKDQGNRSAAVRLLMQLGMQEWRRSRGWAPPKGNKGKV